MSFRDKKIQELDEPIQEIQDISDNLEFLDLTVIRIKLKNLLNTYESILTHESNASERLLELKSKLNYLLDHYDGKSLKEEIIASRDEIASLWDLSSIVVKQKIPSDLNVEHYLKCIVVSVKTLIESCDIKRYHIELEEGSNEWWANIIVERKPFHEILFRVKKVDGDMSLIEISFYQAMSANKKQRELSIKLNDNMELISKKCVG